MSEYRSVNDSLRGNNGLVCQLVSALSQGNHKGFLLRLREIFTKRCIVERTNKAEIRPEEQSERTDICRENL